MKARLFVLGLIVALGAQWVPVEAEQVFDDIEGHDYEESILYLYERGIVEGYDTGDFVPDASVNRAETLKMTYAALGLVENGDHCFTDVTDEWFAPFVCHAKDLGIVHGYDDNTYLPAQEVNMVEAFKILNEAFEMPIRELKDDEDWFQPYLDFMHKNNFTSKYNIYPWRSATRGEMAFWIHQFLLIQDGELDVATVRDAGSEACGHSAPSTVKTEYTVDGQLRTAIVDLPSGYDPNSAYSLIVAFHGRTNSNEDVRGYYKLDDFVGDEAIIVYPAGIWNGSSFSWSNSGDSSDDLRDYDFFDQIVDEMTSSYCVNEDEIYALGHSLGAWFSNSLACARGNVLRAVGTLGGSRSESICTGPSAVMQWHNPNDRLAPFYTGQTARDYYLEQNFCSAEYVEVEPTWPHCVEYQGCMDVATTVWCPHTNDHADYSGEYYPHNWPSDTAKEMWAFFESLD
jgi:polyhydroxybutyrate depolymerase